jgi:hypothetical protein
VKVCQRLRLDAWRCHHCGEAHPTSEFRAIVLSPFAIAVYVVAVLAFITFWFWQEGAFEKL